MNIGDSLIRFHRVVTRGIEVARNRGTEFSASGFPDSMTRQGYLDYVNCLSVLLHGHHNAEDDFAFPCFKLKLPGAPYAQLAAEHQAMQPIMERMNRAVAELRVGRDDSMASLQSALADLDALWQPHIGKEEDHFSCQALARIMPSEEHMALGKTMAEHGQKHSEPHEQTLPFVLFNLPPDQRAEMEKLLPPEITQHLIPVVWKERWAPMQPFLLDR